MARAMRSLYDPVGIEILELQQYAGGVFSHQLRQSHTGVVPVAVSTEPGPPKPEACIESSPNCLISVPS
jgi:hypothetical protein